MAETKIVLHTMVLIFLNLFVLLECPDVLMDRYSVCDSKGSPMVTSVGSRCVHG